MIRLDGQQIYLAALEREDCRTLYREDEYDFEHLTDRLHIGQSVESADKWYEEIQNLMENTHIRLGIFLREDGHVIGQIALQNLDWPNRACFLGYGLSRLCYRGHGYATEAAKLILGYGFRNLGLYRVSATTSDANVASQRVLEKCGFTLEGRDRSVQEFGGRRHDRLRYGLLREEFVQD